MSPQSRPLDSLPGGIWSWASVLVVDDEPGMVHFITRALEPLVGQLHAAGSSEEAAGLVERHRFDLVILDISLPGQSGLDWLQVLREDGRSFEVVLITAFADVDSAITALRAGASDFILKPFRLPQVLNSVRQCLERAQLKRENFLLRRNLEQRAPTPGALVGSSLVIRGLQEAIRRSAAVDSTVLLTGESGTGKELVALALHHGSHRSMGPFVPVNCATLSGDQAEAELFGRSGQDGLFVYAQGGTLFLDEVAELPLAQQASLLRALEERRVRPVGSQQEIPVDVRVVAATNKPLAGEVAAGRFRADLFYRLQVVEIRLAPLRAHKEDIEELVPHFIEVLCTRLGLPAIEVTPEELGYLQAYEWPGNVRELRNFIERSIILGSLNVSALYPPMPRAEPAPALTAPAATATATASPAHGASITDLSTLERRHIEATLRSVGGDKTRASQLLGISRRTLERRVAEWAAQARA
ncbi:MAG: sigma-54-dependent transcriptional regulator [Burkholderiaceae bacterium]